MSRSRVTLALAALLSLAACSDDATGPDANDTRQQSIDLAANAGQAIAMDVMVVQGDLRAAGAMPPGGAGPRVGEGCTWSAASGSWTCQVSQEGGAAITRTITFYSGGATQQNYDAATTDSIRVNATASGSFSREGGSMTFSHSRNTVISGLAGAETRRTINGTGSGSVQGQMTRDGVTRSHSETMTSVEDDVVLPVGGGYPLSGTVTRDVSATFTVSGDRNGSRTIERHVVVTFNGTAIVPMTVDALNCTLNLDTRAVSCRR